MKKTYVVDDTHEVVAASVRVQDGCLVFMADPEDDYNNQPFVVTQMFSKWKTVELVKFEWSPDEVSFSQTMKTKKQPGLGHITHIVDMNDVPSTTKVTDGTYYSDGPYLFGGQQQAH